MLSEIEAAYIVLESPDREALNRYFGEVVSLMPGDAPGAGTSTWRVDGKTHRVLIQDGPRRDATAIGFEAADDAAFERILTRVDSLGMRVHAGSASECAERRVRRLARFPAPWGVDIELCAGLAEADTPFASAGYPNGFVTAGQGFGHAVFAINDAEEYAAARRLAIDGLGLGLSDWLRMPMAAGEMHVSFLHCNARHHSLALAYVPVPELPQRLNHINFEVSSVADVGAALDRAVRAQVPLANTIGQHDNDGMVSFYSISPDLWRVEIGATGRTITEDWDQVREYDRISRWGHHTPEQIAGLQIQHPTAEAPPASKG